MRRYDQFPIHDTQQPYDVTRTSLPLPTTTTHPLGQPIPIPAPTPVAARKGKLIPLLMAGCVVLVSALLVFTSASLGLLPPLPSLGGNTHNAVPPHLAPATKVVGRIYFSSSGQVSENTNQGITDEVDLDLSAIPNPSPGKSYYAWLLDDAASEGKTLLLGALAINHGAVHLHYAGDAEHTNLLAVSNRLLITEEETTPPPDVPSLDSSTWRYMAQIPRTPNPADTVHHFSLLDHLRHLLASDPTLRAAELPGGLDIWLFRNTQKILEWAGSARDDWSPQGVGILRRQTIRVLDYLDGAIYVLKDAPIDTPFLVDPHIGRVALLEFDVQHQEPPGYLYHIGLHLQGLITSPGATTEQKQLALKIDIALNKVQALLQKMRQDAKQLVVMTDAQLLQPEAFTLLDDMVKQAQDAFVGQFDPTTGEIQNGITQIHYAIQRLATLEVTIIPSTTRTTIINPEYIGPRFTQQGQG